MPTEEFQRLTDTFTSLILRGLNISAAGTAATKGEATAQPAGIAGTAGAANVAAAQLSETAVTGTASARPKDVLISTPSEWETLFRLSCRHNVTPLVSAALEHCPDVPIDIRLKFAAMQEQSAEHYGKVKDVTAKLAAAFAKESLKMIVLKGLTLSRLYPSPELRQFSDLDLMVIRADGSPAWQEAERIAFSLGAKSGHGAYHHSTFTLDGVYVENHFDLTSRPIRRSAERYESILKKTLLQDLEKSTVIGQEVLSGSADFEALFLLRHSAVHFEKDCVNLRQILDWMLFLQTRGTRADWLHVCSIYREFGMDGFTGAVMSILRDRIGYDCPLEYISDFASEVDPDTTERVWNEILLGRTRIQNPTQCSTLGRLTRGLVRICRNRWKHELCSNDPLWIDTLYTTRAALERLKQHETR